MRLENDRQIAIATGRSRLSTHWTNKTVKWSKLVEKCSQTHRTTETMAEYLSMSKDEQSRRKDIGGFVGGYLTDGKRKNGMTKFKSIATLDIDFGTMDLWDDFTLSFNCAAFMYSTHKHTPEKPRFRLVILFSRDVTPEEYEPVCRKVAGNLGIDMFDDTTFELPRLFYWPSTPKDGEYFFRYQDGPALDVDGILGEYHNPMDASEWAFSSRATDRIRHEMKKQGDPLDKPGMIGAFCRTYTIEEAIARFLSEVYEPTTVPGRYTYKKGSVAGGLVCYEHKFSYSHHDTDPASRRLCNAFDLVRLHLFGERDEGVNAQDPTKLPSYALMQQFAAKDNATARTLMAERLTDFDDIDVTSLEKDGEWLSKLDSGKNGYKPTAPNIVTILENDPAFKGRLRMNEFTGFAEVEGGLPWNKDSRKWKSVDTASLRVYIESVYGISARDKVRDAKDYVFGVNKYHPVKEYLNSLVWDGKERLDTLLHDYLGAEDTPIVRMMTRKQFVGAVKRVYEPGCKMDYMLVLTGPEGIGKSTLVSVMGGQWFSDSLVTMEGKEGMEALQKSWLIEIGELSGMKRSDVESVKTFLSRQDDIYRPAYGDTVESHPRHCVFFGTTNEKTFLKGDFGNRRFWVVQLSEKGEKSPKDDLPGERDQLWAEAVVRYRRGESLYLPAELELQAREIQAKFNDANDDPVIGLIEQFLNTLLPIEWNSMSMDERRAYFQNGDGIKTDGSVLRTKVCAMEISRELFGDKPGEKSKYTSRYINQIMSKMKGWEPVSSMRFSAYGTQRGFRRIALEDPDEERL